MPDSTTLLLTGMLVAVGAGVSAMAGFGFGIALMPFMILLYPPKEAVVLTLLIAMCGVSIQWFRVRQHAHYPLMAKLVAGTLMGVPLGGYVLGVIEPGPLKALIGIAVLVAAVLSLARRSGADLPPRMPSTGLSLAAGFGAGILATTVGQPGITVASLMTWTRLDKQVVRATLVSYFVLADAGSMVAFYVQGILTRELALTAFALIPFYLIGLVVGDWGFRHSGQVGYRRLVLGLLSVSAVLGLYSGLHALFE
ncbi:MAG: sulfite exporter TauE/SafE family protein [Bacillota bacterium]